MSKLSFSQQAPDSQAANDQGRDPKASCQDDNFPPAIGEAVKLEPTGNARENGCQTQYFQWAIVFFLHRRLLAFLLFARYWCFFQQLVNLHSCLIVNDNSFSVLIAVVSSSRTPVKTKNKRLGSHLVVRVST